MHHPTSCQHFREYKPEYEKLKREVQGRAEKRRNRTQMSKFKKDHGRDDLIRIGRYSPTCQCRNLNVDGHSIQEPMRPSDLLGRGGGSSDDDEDSLSDEMDPEGQLHGITCFPYDKFIAASVALTACSRLLI